MCSAKIPKTHLWIDKNRHNQWWSYNHYCAHDIMIDDWVLFNNDRCHQCLSLLCMMTDYCLGEKCVIAILVCGIDTVDWCILSSNFNIGFDEQWSLSWEWLMAFLCINPMVVPLPIWHARFNAEDCVVYEGKVRWLVGTVKN